MPDVLDSTNDLARIGRLERAQARLTAICVFLLLGLGLVLAWQIIPRRSLDAGLKKESPKGASRDAAVKVGTLVAERAKKAGVTKVVFDRGGYRYHGRVKALAEGARTGGLEF